jgi:hypothetical protein
MSTSARRFSRWSPLALLLALAGCAESVASVPTQAPPPNGPEGPQTPIASTPAPSTPPSSGGSVDGHKLAIAAAACWLGGVWGDALGETADQRKTNDEARCNDVVKQVYGAEDKGRYEKLRALDPAAVDEVAAKAGGQDSAPGKLALAVGVAQREAMEARRAGDKVKKDLTGGREPEKLTTDEAAAVKSLQAQDALAALDKVDAGALTADAKGLLVLTAMERIEQSRGLPKHLKVYAMQGAANVLFGATAPALPTDATQKLPKGAYLTYVVDVAKAAGHPVADTVTAPRDRETAAWSGVLLGIRDKLKPQADAVGKDTPLADVLANVVKRLDTSAPAPKAAPAGAAAKPGEKPAPADKAAPATKPAAGAKATTPAPATPAPAKPAAPPAKK